MRMWFLLATIASMGWGIAYILVEHIFKQVSVYTTLAVEMLVMGAALLVMALVTGNVKKDLAAIGSSPKLFWTFIAFIVASTLAEVAINFSISQKNATVAGFVEISYPFFIALFAYLLYGQDELNTGTVLGGFIIFVGACIIFYFGR